MLTKPAITLEQNGLVLGKKMQTCGPEYYAYESKIMNRLQSLSADNDDEWYIISMQWYRTLILCHQSAIKHPGLPIKRQPTEIDNNDLFQNVALKRIDPNLICGQHYTAVKDKMWNFLYRKYGGGPIICRKQKSIYSAEVTRFKKKAKNERFELFGIPNYSQDCYINSALQIYMSIPELFDEDN
jgi:hypothetical protein